MENIVITIFLACIGLMNYQVYSHPAQLSGSAATGVELGGGLASQGSTAANTAGSLATNLAGAGTLGAGMGMAKAAESANAVMNGLLSAASSADVAAKSGLQLGAALGAGALDAAAAGLNSGMGLQTTMNSAGSTGMDMASNLGLSSFSSNAIPYLQARAEFSNALRNGLGGLFNYADDRTGQMNNVFRVGATGGSEAVDAGLSAFGIQQPIATPIVNAGWNMGESLRDGAFRLGRLGANGAFYVADPSVYTTQAIRGLAATLAGNSGLGGSGSLLTTAQLPTAAAAVQGGAAVGGTA